jgi:hypothetical protein
VPTDDALRRDVSAEIMRVAKLATATGLVDLDYETTTIIARVRQHVAEEHAQIAEDPCNLDMVGGSTGNAWGTAKRIAAALRQAAEKVERGS